MHVTVYWGRMQDIVLAILTSGRLGIRGGCWCGPCGFGDVSQCDMALGCPGQAEWLAHWVDGDMVTSHARCVTPQHP